MIYKDPETGATLGGISGRASLGMMFIDLVYLPVSLRGRDLGQRMMAMAEAEGRRRGCKSGVVPSRPAISTISSILGTPRPTPPPRVSHCMNSLA